MLVLTRPRVVVGLGKSGHTQHRQVDEQPTKRSKKNDKNAASYVEEKVIGIQPRSR